MAETLKHEFTQYLDMIYPAVLKNAAIKIEFHVEDVLVDNNNKNGNDNEDNDKIISRNIDLKLLGG